MNTICKYILYVSIAVFLFCNIYAETVVLGGNEDPSVTTSLWMYTIIIDGQTSISNLSVISGNTYEVGTNLQVGSLAYTNNSYQYITVPPEVAGLTYIKTYYLDRDRTELQFLQFDTPFPVDVYVAYDDRYSVKPSWLISDYVDSGLDAVIEFPGTTFSLFKKTFESGNTVGASVSDSLGMQDEVSVLLESPDITTLNVGLEWDAVTTDVNGDPITVDGYNMYRSIISGSDYTRVNSNTISPTTYLDAQAVLGRRYYYVCTAVKDTLESGFSNEASFASCLGDANFDNSRNIFDIITIMNHVVGNSILTGNELIVADVNEDSAVNIFDVVSLQNVIVGNTTLPDCP